jgi:hypothetical protein
MVSDQDVKTMGKQQTDYMSFMLRLWHVGDGEPETLWRASLQNSLTGERMSFATLEELFAFLRQLIAVVPDVDATSSRLGKQNGCNAGCSS